MIVDLEKNILLSFYEAFAGTTNILLHPQKVMGQPLNENELIELYNRVDKTKLNLIWVDTDFSIRNSPPNNVILLHPCQIKRMHRILFRPPIVNIEKFDPIEKGEKPTIGFCGHGGFSDKVVGYFRKNYIKILESHKNFDCHFIVRDNFTGQNVNDKLTTEYINNMKKCMFNFCNRGAGAYSIRLYETLSAGRIPIFTTEQTVLCDQVPYQDACIVAHNIYDMIDKILYTFDNKDLVSMQNRARKIYEDFFEITSYFKLLRKNIGA